MAAIISLQNIQQLVSNLPYPSAKTLKSRLVQAIMHNYNDAETVRALQIIPAEALIQALWQTGDDAVLIRKKQKNLSSVRSSVNIDLKKLASKGKNPDGLQLSNANIFVMSDEAKDKALDEFLDKLPGDKPANLDEITKILQMVDGMLSNLEANESNESTDRQDFVTELKSVIDGLNSKISSDAFGNDNHRPSDHQDHENVPKQESPGANLVPEAGQTQLSDRSEASITPGQGDGKSLTNGNIPDETGKSTSGTYLVIDPEEGKSVLASDLDDLPIQKEDIDGEVELEELEFADDADLAGGRGNGGSIDGDDKTSDTGQGEGLASIAGNADDGAANSGRGDNLTNADGTGVGIGASESDNKHVGAALANGSDTGQSEDLATITDRDNNLESRDGTDVGIGASESGNRHIDAALANGSDTEPLAEDEIADDDLENLEIVDDLDDADIIDDDYDDEVELEELEFADDADLAGGQGDGGSITGDDESSDTGQGEDLASVAGDGNAGAANSGKGDNLANADLTGVEIGSKDSDKEPFDAALANGSDTEPTAEDEIADDNLENLEIVDDLDDADIIDDDYDDEVELEELEFADDADLAGGQGDGGSITGDDETCDTGQGEDLARIAGNADDGAANSGKGDNIANADLTGVGIGASESGNRHVDAALADGADTEPTAEDEIADDDLENLEIVDDLDDADIIDDDYDDEVDLEELEFADDADLAGSQGDGGSIAEDDETSDTGQGEDLGADEGSDADGATKAGRVHNLESGDGPGIALGSGYADKKPIDTLAPTDSESELVAADEIEDHELDETEIADDLDDIDIINDDELEQLEFVDAIDEEEPEFVDNEEAIEGFGDSGEASLGDDPQREDGGTVGLQNAGGEITDQVSPDNTSDDNGLDRVEAIGVEDTPDWSQNPQKAKLLAEEFNRSLAAMDKFFNQYIKIPAGSYILGYKQPTGKQKPETSVQLPEYYIGKFPVTNALFELFIENTGYQTTAEKQGKGTVYTGRSQHITDPQTGQEHKVWHADIQYQTIAGACWYQPRGPGSTIHKKRNHPVVQVSLQDAMAFAAWTGKRLPSEAEWEAAARTTDSLVFPWGNAWQSQGCNIEESGVSDTTAVDCYLEFINNFGVADTLGNVLEWTSCAANGNARAAHSAYYIVKGGSWISGPDIGLYSQFQQTSDGHSNLLGFRCVAF